MALHLTELSKFMYIETQNLSLGMTQKGGIPFKIHKTPAFQNKIL